MKKEKISLFDTVNVILLTLMMLLFTYPIYFTIIASFSDPNAVASGEVLWRPIGFTLEAYKYVIEYKQIWMGYLNTIIYTIFGTVFNLVLTIPAAYMLSKKYLPYRNVLMTVFMITMYFSGGMVPTYLLIKNLGLLNTRLILIIINGISVYNMIITRTYFNNSIPDALYEAAEIDGASEWKRFVSIALPLAKPIIAVMVLYYAVAHWNSYFSEMLYNSDSALKPLQIVLRDVLLMNENMFSASISSDGDMDAEFIYLLLRRNRIAYTMKYAVVFIASAPMLILYPFVQKHFVKGIMIGSVKE